MLNPKASRPPVLELVDQAWAADKLSDDEVEVGRHEADAGGFEEGELDADAIVVSPAGNSSSAANSGMCRLVVFSNCFLFILQEGGAILGRTNLSFVTRDPPYTKMESTEDSIATCFSLSQKISLLCVL